MKWILASASPRRKQLLESIGWDLEIHPAKKEEIFDLSLPLDQALKNVALAKAKEVYPYHPNLPILSADTIVVWKEKILGKPRSLTEAMETLSQLSGQYHEVKTGVAILYQQKVISFVCTSKIQFRSLSQYEILEYVSKQQPLDKAGSYGIQECDFVQSYTGEYENIVGLPIHRLQEEIEKAEIFNAKR